MPIYRLSAPDVVGIPFGDDQQELARFQRYRAEYATFLVQALTSGSLIMERCAPGQRELAPHSRELTKARYTLDVREDGEAGRITMTTTGSTDLLVVTTEGSMRMVDSVEAYVDIPGERDIFPVVSRGGDTGRYFLHELVEFSADMRSCPIDLPASAADI